MRSVPNAVLCLSHLRWKFVYQRPQHLLSRCARERRVIFFEEPLYDGGETELELTETPEGVLTIVPHLAPGTSFERAEAVQRKMIDHVLEELAVPEPILWYYTPMALGFTDHVNAAAVVYDCMDELSMFQGAPPELVQRERRLLERADVVFTGGNSLYEYKRGAHHNIHPFPSSVDVDHFARARELVEDPADQEMIAHPRVGFFGVIDERMNLGLLSELADMRPDLQLVMIGPVVKIDPSTLPRRDNIHWLGSKTYAELPSYLAGWDVAMLPFAINDSTRFISPTKTPEYLAAGCPVVSTPIRDVVEPYGRQGLAWIANTETEFSVAIDEALASDQTARRAQADAFLSELSWDKTWGAMWAHVERAMAKNEAPPLFRIGTGTGATQHALSKREE
ncbi:MAG TPA: glycosyltransferase family 1 protein [Kofleriaceae bacterium]|nr:glycosyltransferase family 1 protein [Kofleriaceae bacterium]